MSQPPFQEKHIKKKKHLCAEQRAQSKWPALSLSLVRTSYPEHEQERAGGQQTALVPATLGDLFNTLTILFFKLNKSLVFTLKSTSGHLRAAVLLSEPERQHGARQFNFS